MNKTIEQIAEYTVFAIMIITIAVVIIVKDERKTQIKYLEQSLNEQIEEKQVYMNMLEERSKDDGRGI